jgi:hypothetical protein
MDEPGHCVCLAPLHRSRNATSLTTAPFKYTAPPVPKTCSQLGETCEQNTDCCGCGRRWTIVPAVWHTVYAPLFFWQTCVRAVPLTPKPQFRTFCLCCLCRLHPYRSSNSAYCIADSSGKKTCKTRPGGLCVNGGLCGALCWGCLACLVVSCVYFMLVCAIANVHQMICVSVKLLGTSRWSHHLVAPPSHFTIYRQVRAQLRSLNIRRVSMDCVKFDALC